MTAATSTCGCARHRSELLHVFGISTPDYCPACLCGYVVDEEGFPVLKNGEPVRCELCRGQGVLYEPCCGPHPAGEEHDEHGRVAGMHR